MSAPFSNTSSDSKGKVKALKGRILSGDFGDIDQLSSKSLKIENIEVTGQIEGGIFSNVQIINSTINSTPIGKDVPAPGCFTELTATDGINFVGTTAGSVVWNPDTGIYYVDPFLIVEECATIGDLAICDDFIRSAVNNGDLRLIQNGIGTIFVTGPISQQSSHGNVTFVLNTGGYSFVGGTNIDLFSSHGSFNLNTFNDQTLCNQNGDITIQTDKNITKGNISLIQITGGNIFVNSTVFHGLKPNDTIQITGSSLVDGTHIVDSIVNNTLIRLQTTSASTTTSTSGCFQRTNLNNIVLDSKNLVTIPENTKLTFGDTCNNIYSNTQALVISSCNDICFEIPPDNKIKIPNLTTLDFGDGAFTFQNSGGSFFMRGTSLLQLDNLSMVQINTTNLSVYDPIITLSDRISYSGDLQDRGIEFYYWDTSVSRNSLGWFGWKNSSHNFTLILRATNNNEIITGDVGNLELQDLVLQNIILVSGGTIDMNCGQILEVDLITACTVNNLTIQSQEDIYIQANNQIHLDASSEILINSNVPLNFGTVGSGIIQNTSNSLVFTADNNIELSTRSFGSIIIPQETHVTFTGTSNNNTSISSDTNGNLTLTSKSDINLYTTSGNVAIPSSTPLIFGSTTQSISGNSSGINLLSNSTINLLSNSDVCISSSSGNITLKTRNSGDIILDSTNGQIRIPQTTPLVFNTDVNNTSNSIVYNSSGDIVFTGDNTNSFVFKNLDSIDLSAASVVTIPDSTPLVFGGDFQIVNNSMGETYVTNTNFSTGALVINSLTTSITGGRLFIINDTTNVRSTYTTWSVNTMTITGTQNSLLNICTEDVRFKDPILTISDNQLTSLDNKDRGIEYFYYNTAASTTHLGWFGWKSNTGFFTFYESATNSNETITGTLGTIELGNLNVENILLTTIGTLDIACGSILNVDTITGCSDHSLTIFASQNLNISSENIYVTTSSITIPQNSNFNFSSLGSFSMNSSGTLSVSSSNNIIIQSSLIANSSSVRINSTDVRISDPILTLGQNSLDDNKDRGIEFLWNSGGSMYTGFFGFDDSIGKFVFVPNASISGEVVSGNVGDVLFNTICASDIQLDNGIIQGVQEISGGDIIIRTTSGDILLSPTQGQSVIIPSDISLQIGTSSILASSNGNLDICVPNELLLKSDTISLETTSGVYLGNSSPLYFNSSGTKSIACTTDGNLEITNSVGDVVFNLNTNSSVLLPEGTPIGFSGDTNNCIFSSDGQLFIKGFDAVQILSSNVNVSGDINIIGTITATNIDLELNESLLCLGTLQILPISNVTTNNLSTNGNVLVEVIVDHYFTIGDSITLQNTNAVPLTNGDFIVADIIDSKTFTINGPTLTTPGNDGTVKSGPMIDPTTDMGVKFQYWTSSGNVGLTSGSLGIRNAFFGIDRTDLRFKMCEQATIVNSVVTDCVLGDIQTRKLFADEIAAFTLCGELTGNTQTISGSQFDINGGAIDSTPIGSNIASTARFTTLTNTIQADLTALNILSTLSMSKERYTMDSVILPNRSPSTSLVTSMFRVTTGSFTATGTMGPIVDGGMKIFVAEYIAPNSEYILHFGTSGSSKLIFPCNPCNNIIPGKLKFTCTGQSITLVYCQAAGGYMNIFGGACTI